MHFKGISRFALSFILALTVILPSLTVIASEQVSVAEGKGITVVLHKDGKALNIVWNASYIDAEYADIVMSVHGTGDRAVLTDVDVSSGNASVDILGSEYMYSPFYLGRKTSDGYERLTEPVCLSDTQLAGDTFNYPSAHSKKGLDIRLISDSQQLGVCHTVINVELNKLISDDTSSSHTVSIYSKTYYFDDTYVNSLDHKIKVMSDSGINVYLQAVLTPPDEATGKNAKKLYCTSTSENAEYYGLGIDDGGEYLYSAMTFLAGRYSVEDGKFGFAGSYIIGNCVNSNRFTNYSGQMSVKEYTDRYARAFRCAYMALKNTYANAKVYVSVNGCYNTPVRDISPDSMLDYSAKEFLTLFNGNIKQYGDLGWSLAAELYNADIQCTEYWREDKADMHQSTPFVTMKNISVLDSFLSDDELLYNGNKRKITVSSCAFSSGNNTQTEQKKQAAAYALAYYTCESMASVEAFIYSSHVDSENDVCKNSGLYTSKDDSLGMTDEKKEIYRVFESIDTDMSNSVTAPYTSILGISSYTDIIKDHTADQEKRIVLTGLPISNINRPDTVIFDFSDGVCGFYPSDNAKSVTSQGEGKYGQLVCQTYNTDVREYRGVCRMLTDTHLSKTGYVSFDIAVNAPENTEYADVMILMKGVDAVGRSIVFEGVSQIPVTEISTLTYDISDFLALTGNSAQSMKIRIKPHSEKDGGNYSMTLSNVRFLNENASFVPMIISISVCLALLVICIGAYYIFKARRQMRTSPSKTHTLSDEEYI